MFGLLETSLSNALPLCFDRLMFGGCSVRLADFCCVGSQKKLGLVRRRDTVDGRVTE